MTFRRRARPPLTLIQAALCILTPRMPKALRTRRATTVLRPKREAELESHSKCDPPSLNLSCFSVSLRKKKKNLRHFKSIAFFIPIIKHTVLWSVTYNNFNFICGLKPKRIYQNPISCCGLKFFSHVGPCDKPATPAT